MRTRCRIDRHRRSESRLIAGSFRSFAMVSDKSIDDRRRVLEPVARRSICVKAELVAVRVCQLDVVGQVGTMRRAERDQSFRLASGVGAD
jgi:hypothetical protein